MIAKDKFYQPQFTLKYNDSIRQATYSSQVKNQTLYAIICANRSPWLPFCAKREKSPTRSKTLWRQGSSWKRSGGFNQPALALQKKKKKQLDLQQPSENPQRACNILYIGISDIVDHIQYFRFAIFQPPNIEFCCGGKVLSWHPMCIITTPIYR